MSSLMKPLGILLIMVALMSFGCATSTPPVSNRSPLPEGTEQDPLTKKAEPQNDVGWGLLYLLLDVGGTVATRQ
jgi:hypothetical protein